MDSENRDIDIESNEVEYLIPSNNPIYVNNSISQTLRDEWIITSLFQLNYIHMAISWSIILTLVVWYLNALYASVPNYIPYSCMVIGQLIVTIVIIHTFQLMYKALFADGNDSHIAFDRRLKISVFIAYHLLIILLISESVTIINILLYFNIEHSLSSAYVFLFLYLISFIGLAATIYLRNAPIGLVLTFFLLVLLIVALNMKIILQDSLPWMVVFMPMYAICCYWLIYGGHQALRFMDNVIILKSYQLESLTLYLLSVKFFILSLISYQWHMIHDSSRDPRVAILLSILGFSCFFSASGKVLYANICLKLQRMGSDRPQPLMRMQSSITSKRGGWDKHPEIGYESCLLLGEIDYHRQTGSNNH